jgi:hypothetical protein
VKRPASPPLPGDDLIPDAAITLDRDALFTAPPEQVWPWLLQLGKRRAGWYLTRRIERLLPRGRRALRRVEPRFQAVVVGERIPDYGPGGWFEARVVDPPHTLVWWSQRGRGLAFSWALILEPVGANSTRLVIRLRINRRIGKRVPWLAQRVGELFDLITIRLMFAGLRERL